MHTLYSHSLKSHRSAFTLVELLVVMMIVTILMTLGGMTLNGIVQSSDLRRAGESVSGMIAQARQEAVRRNQEVQVRLIQLPEEGVTAISTTDRWSAVQLYLIKETVDGPKETPLGELQRLPTSIEVSTDAALSPLLMDSNHLGTMNAGGFTNVSYRAFRFRSNGGLDKRIHASTASTPGNNVLTLQLRPAGNAVTTEETIPANYYAIQVNPVTGQVEVYRP